MWVGLAGLLVVGYLAVGRSFAYVGLPWFSLYIGELALAAFLMFGPATKQGRWIEIAKKAPDLRRLKLLFLVSLGYGAFQALRGIAAGHPIFSAARDTAFNYYPLYLLLGIWVGLRDRDLLRRVVRILAWCNGCYGLAYALFLNQLPWTWPGTSEASSTVPFFTEPLGSAISLLGLLAFEPELRRVWHLLALNGLVMLFVQMRAEWLGFFLGLFVFTWCTKRLKQMAAGAALLASVLVVMYFAKIELPSPEGRGGQISTQAIVARALAPVSENAAASLATEEDMVGYTGTTVWRLFWWAEIWNRVHSNPLSTLFGLGYGYPIGDLNPFIEPGTFIRTPHNDFFYVLGYTGWFGVILFALFQVELLSQLIQRYKATRQPFGLMCWVALITISMFGDFFEAPMGAIPFYLLAGMAVAPEIVAPHRTREANRIGRPLRPSEHTSERRSRCFLLGRGVSRELREAWREE
jgi:hypothetical protein